MSTSPYLGCCPADPLSHHVHQRLLPVPRRKVPFAPPLSDIRTTVHVVKAHRKSLALKWQKPAHSRIHTPPRPCPGSRGPASGDFSLRRAGLQRPCQRLVLADATCRAAQGPGNRLDVLSGKRHHVVQGEEHVFPASQSLSKRHAGFFCKANTSVTGRMKHSARSGACHSHRSAGSGLPAALLVHLKVLSIQVCPQHGVFRGTGDTTASSACDCPGVHVRPHTGLLRATTSTQFYETP